MSQGGPVVHIHRPAGEYVVTVRRRGYRRWRAVHRTKSRARAFRALGAAMAAGQYHRGAVLWCAFEWYDPVPIAEMRMT